LYEKECDFLEKRGAFVELGVMNSDKFNGVIDTWLGSTSGVGE